MKRTATSIIFNISIILMPLGLIACGSESDHLEDVLETGYYEPTNIAEQMDGRIYINNNRMGFGFHNSGDTLYYDLYRFGLNHDAPIKSRENVEVKVIEQKSTGTWVFILEGERYLLNQTDMRLISFEGETLFPHWSKLPEIKLAEIKKIPLNLSPEEEAKAKALATGKVVETEEEKTAEKTEDASEEETPETQSEEKSETKENTSEEKKEMGDSDVSSEEKKEENEEESGHDDETKEMDEEESEEEDDTSDEMR